MLQTLEERWRAKVRPDPASGCWLWQGAKDDCGYGRLYTGRKHQAAHRLAYEFFKGPIADGLEVDHLCHVRNCVNPDHLEAVPHHINVLRSPVARAAVAARATHCIHGHPFDDANTGIAHHKNGRPMRICRACREQRRRKGQPISQAGAPLQSQ